MDVLLYFVSFGSAVTLFVVTSVTALWILFKVVRAWARFFLALIDPARSANRVRIDPNPHALKRAGQ